MQRGGRAYTRNNNPYSCNLSNNTSFMTFLRVRNRENNKEPLTPISENKNVWGDSMPSIVIVVFLFFMWTVSLLVSLTTGHWSRLRLRCDDVFPGLITGDWSWQKPSDYIRHQQGPSFLDRPPGLFLASSNNKVFVPVRNWLQFWRCCIKLLMVDILTSGKHFLEQPGPSNIYNSNLIFVHERLWTFDVLRFYFV